MSSARLYYTDPYLQTFTASVVDTLSVGGRPAVVLDQTAFYPTSGGQPFDTGTLDDVRVIEVVDRDDGGVAHVLERGLERTNAITGRIDWARRFDHMQQHTGQHVLSAAFDRLHGARTESFHLGSESATIDFAVPLSPEALAAAEDSANGVVWDDRPVRVRFVDEAEAAALPLRKEPARGGTLRVVEVEAFDLSACGGTHVLRTGAIGIIAVLGAERFKGGTRVEFVCGGRALARFRQLRDIVMASVRTLSVLPAELPAAIERQQLEVRNQKQAARALQQRLVQHEAAAIAARASAHGGIHLAAERVEGFDVPGLKTLAAAIANRAGHVVVLIGVETPASVVVARAADVRLDAGVVLKALAARFGGKGGGRPELAQGGGLTGSGDEILRAAREEVLESFE
jgi:alanyl-tRNA synthetase